jgi:4-amino-4-deoxy-L-arabinose transferase-like glycosyltransferase
VLIEQVSPSTTTVRASGAGATFYLLSALILGLYIALGIGVASTAAPWCDEGWLSNPALTFLRNGYFGTPILTSFGWGPPQNLLHIQQKTYWIMPLHMMAQAGWYRLFGFSLLSLRTLSVFFGAILVVALGYLAYSLTNRRRIALLAMAIAGTDYFLMTRAADGRMDMMAAAFEISALAVYAAGREKHFTRTALLSGTLAGLASFTHPVGGFFAFSGVAILALYFDRRRIRIRHIVLFAFPVIIIGCCYGLYVAQDLPAFRAQMSGNAYGRWEGVSNLYWSVFRELRYKYFQAFGLNTFTSLSLQNLRLIPLTLYVAAPIALSLTKELRRRTGIRALLWVIAFFVFGGMAFDGAKRWYYLTYVVPLFALSLATWFDWLVTRRSILRLFATAGCGLILAINIGGTLFRIRKNDLGNSFDKAAEFVRQRDPEHALIYGSGELGFSLGFPDYLVDDLSLGYFSGRKAKLIFVPSAYWNVWIDSMSLRAPMIGAFEKATLAHEYKRVYHTADYQIYERTQ